jgi:hypothetical protein
MSVSQNYVTGRKKWKRPQALLWSDVSPTIAEDGKLLPTGWELGSNIPEDSDTEDRFMILSDHNRSPIDMSNERIEQRQRMANGTMRSYFIADKLTVSTSWVNLPSRAFQVYPDFDQEFGRADIIQPSDSNKVKPFKYFAHESQQYTADGGAGGAEILDWYENHTGPFWVMLSYDKYPNFGDDDAARNRLSEYTQSLQMYISSFSYSVVKRGGTNFDMWDISLTLEEV